MHHHSALISNSTSFPSARPLMMGFFSFYLVNGNCISQKDKGKEHYFDIQENLYWKSKSLYSSPIPT
jgi:hypothetical protein